MAPSKEPEQLKSIAERILSRPYREPLPASDDTRRERDRRNQDYAEFIGSRTRYAQCRLDQWRTTEGHETQQNRVLEGVREYVSDLTNRRAEGVGALFYGPPGTGKDHLATCIIRAACLEHGQSARFVNGVDWFGAIRDSMDDDRKSEASLLKECTRPDWLVLSDPLPPIGNLTVFQAGMLYRLIDARNSEGKPTVVTLNVADGSEATARMGAPTWDRLKDRAWIFPCAWPSYRKPARQF